MIEKATSEIEDVEVGDGVFLAFRVSWFVGAKGSELKTDIFRKGQKPLLQKKYLRGPIASIGSALEIKRKKISKSASLSPWHKLRDCSSQPHFS